MLECCSKGVTKALEVLYMIMGKLLKALLHLQARFRREKLLSEQ